MQVMYTYFGRNIFLLQRFHVENKRQLFSLVRDVQDVQAGIIFLGKLNGN